MRSRRLLIIFLIVLFLLGGIIYVFLYRQQIRETLSKTKDITCTSCNIVLISLDTLRADDLPCYGYTRNTAPNLCAFAKNNILFSQPYSHSSYTLSSHFSIFTSLYPHDHGMLLPFKKDVLNPSITTLTQTLKAQNYETIYIGPQDDPALPLTRGLERGFDYLIDNLFTSGWKEGYDRLLKNSVAGKPTFLFLHTYAVHEPYLAGHNPKVQFTDKIYPNIAVTDEEYIAYTEDLHQLVLKDLLTRYQSETNTQNRNNLKSIYDRLKNANNLATAGAIFNSMSDMEKNSYHDIRWIRSIDEKDPGQVEYLRALYDERINQLDAELPKLFSILSNPQVSKRTIVIITADHGEDFMEHGQLFHWGNVYNSATHVPLIMSIPGVQPKRITDLVQSIDIYPTVMDLLHLKKLTWFDGISLADTISGKPDASKNNYLFSEYNEGSTISIRNERWKLYVTTDGTKKNFELYDLLNDPLEQHDMSSLHQDTVAQLNTALKNIPTMKFSIPSGDFPEWLDQEKRQKINHSGYF